MPRGRKKKFKLNINTDSAKSILAIGLLILSGLSLVSFISPDRSLNAKVQSLLRDNFGLTAIAAPFLLAIIALLFIEPIKWRIKSKRVVLGLILAFFSLSGFVSSGILGTKVHNKLEEIISSLGAWLVLGGGLAISLILIFNVSIDQVISFFGAAIEKLKSFVPKKQLSIPNIKISSGIKNLSTQESVDTEVKPSFEIIPSMSEPQIGREMSAEGIFVLSDSNITTLSTPSALPYSNKVWETPPLDLLIDQPPSTGDKVDVAEKAKVIEKTLKSFDINAEVVDIQSGPSVTQYALDAQIGTKISKISWRPLQVPLE